MLSYRSYSFWSFLSLSTLGSAKRGGFGRFRGLMRSGFRKLFIVSILFLIFCCASAYVIEASRYRPEVLCRDVEKYDVTVRVYFLHNDDFQQAAKFYFGPNSGNILGFTVSNVGQGWIDIYLPKTVEGKVDVAILGHEFSHALDYAAKVAKSGYESFDADYEFGVGRLVLPDDTVVEFRFCEQLAHERYRNEDY